MSSESLESCWVFDVDGVVGDTRLAVREAYKRVGVRQPEEAWGISWKIWLPALVGDRAPEVHAAKQEVYVSLLMRGFATKLPGADMALALLEVGHPVYFVTAASEASARAVLMTFGLPEDLLRGWELSPSDRTEALLDVKVPPCARQHVYVDDREEGANIAAAAGYGFVHARWTQ